MKGLLQTALIGVLLLGTQPAVATCETILNRELGAILHLPDRGLVSQLHRLDPDRQSITIRLARVWKRMSDTQFRDTDECAVMRSELVDTLESWFAQRFERLLTRDELNSFAFEWSLLVMEGGTTRMIPACIRRLQPRYLEAIRTHLLARLRQNDWGLPWRDYSALTATLVHTEPFWARGFHASTCAISNWRTGETYFRPIGIHQVTDLEVCWFHELSHHAYARAHLSASPVEHETNAWTQTLGFLERFSRAVPLESWSVELRLLYLRLRAEGPAHFSEAVLPHYNQLQ